MIVIKGRGIARGKAEGLALVSKEPISFYGGVDPLTGIVIEKDHPLEGRSLKDKILVFPYGKGSTVGTYIIYRLVKNGIGPIGIINLEAEPIVAVGAVISGIPLIDRIGEDIFNIIQDNDFVHMNGDDGLIYIKKKSL